jgi:hypothetical protein
MRKITALPSGPGVFLTCEMCNSVKMGGNQGSSEIRRISRIPRENLIA